MCKYTNTSYSVFQELLKIQESQPLICPWVYVCIFFFPYCIFALIQFMQFQMFCLLGLATLAPHLWGKGKIVYSYGTYGFTSRAL